MIKFNSLIPEFELSKPQLFKNWLWKVMHSEDRRVGEINYIFCDDTFLLKINKLYLNHDTLTDIITFPASLNKEVISGEIYISIQRVKENAKGNGLDFMNELSRVLVHGVLHLIGYKDSTSLEKIEMRAKEDYYLNLQP